MSFVYFWLAILVVDYAARNENLFWRLFALISSALLIVMSFAELLKGGAA